MMVSSLNYLTWWSHHLVFNHPHINLLYFDSLILSSYLVYSSSFASLDLIVSCMCAIVINLLTCSSTCRITYIPPFKVHIQGNTLYIAYSIMSTASKIILVCLCFSYAMRSDINVNLVDFILTQAFQMWSSSVKRHMYKSYNQKTHVKIMGTNPFNHNL